MAHDAPQAAGPTKLVIRNIGLLLSGALEKPILDADTIVAVNGRITAIGRAKDVDTEGATTVDRRQRHHGGAGPDRQPCPSRRRRLDAAAEPDRLDRQLSAWRRHHHDLGRRGPHARPSARRRRPQGDGDLRAARVLDAAARRREGACRRAGDRMRDGRGGFQGAGRGRRQAARRSRARRRQGRPDRAQDGGLGAQIRHPEHDPHRRPVDPRLRPDRRGRGAGGRHRRDRPYQWRPHRAARRPRSAASARAASAASNWFTTATSARRSTRCGIAREMGDLNRVILGTDSPAGSGVQPLGILRMVSMLSSLGDVPAELAFCFATGNTARMRELDCGLIEVGRAADFVIMDKAQHSAGKNHPRQRAARRPARHRHDHHRRHRPHPAQPQHAAGDQGAVDRRALKASLPTCRHPSRRGQVASQDEVGIGGNAEMLPLSSCPGLSRASTSWLHVSKKDVDGRDKPGHDEKGNLKSASSPCPW